MLSVVSWLWSPAKHNIAKQGESNCNSLSKIFQIFRPWALHTLQTFDTVWGLRAALKIGKILEPSWQRDKPTTPFRENLQNHFVMARLGWFAVELKKKRILFEDFHPQSVNRGTSQWVGWGNQPSNLKAVCSMECGFLTHQYIIESVLTQ